MPNQTLFQQIAQEISVGDRERRKVATVHMQILLYANELSALSRYEVCSRVGLRESYAIEISKMINLAELLVESGYEIVRRVAPK